MRPLTGKRVLITRAHPGAETLANRLTALGAEVVLAPTIAIEPIADPAPLFAQVARLTAADWVVITSPTAARLWALCTGTVTVPARLAAIGEATAAELRSQGLPVAFTGARATGAALASSLLSLGPTGRFLLPRSDKAVADLPIKLRSAGADVIECDLYRTVSRPWTADEVRAVGAGVDAVTVMSPSALDGLLSQPGVTLWLSRARLVAMGPTTASAVTARLGRPDAVADPPSIEALIASLCAVLGHTGG
ncbi:MAG: uroporphyrinogen-III synthase [Candidatus Sericytochromatia bacterium]|nr:uroporphyrinogen-III synthase [Candidatus Sericytochromatia bacterium]